jgi:membrane protein DedA with SNARE-associated domain
MDNLIYWLKTYGYLGVFSSLMLGMFGLPVPDETILTFTGYLIYKNYLLPGPAILAAYFGSICGITLNYLAGRFVGFPLLHEYGHYFGMTDERIALAHRWFVKYGKFTLFVGYFLPGLRHLTAFTAGASRLKYLAFAPFAYSGGLCWVCAFIAVGYFVGEGRSRIVPQIQTYLWLAVGLVLLTGLAVYLVQRRRRRHRENCNYGESGAADD